MPPLNNLRQELFARRIVEGARICDAYAEVYPKARSWKPTVVRVRSSQLHNQPQVLARIKELSVMEEDKTVATRRELAQFYTSVLRTPVGHVTPDHPLAQDVTEVSGRDGESAVRVKMPGKIEAARELGRMLGYYEPEKTDTTVRIAPDVEVLAELDRVVSGRPALGQDATQRDLDEDEESDG